MTDLPEDVDADLMEQLSSLSGRLSALSDDSDQTTDAMIADLYDELRALARAHLAKLPPGNSLLATGLVHEAFLRLGGDLLWDGKGHFFGAAAQAMRQVLVDRARRKKSIKRGGDRKREELDESSAFVLQVSNDELLSLHDALTSLEKEDPRRAMVAKLRYFAGLQLSEIADQMEVSERTVKRDWRLARAALKTLMTADENREA